MERRVRAEGMNFRELNNALRQLKNINPEALIRLYGVNGQRYIGAGFRGCQLDIHGLPGNDLAAFAGEARINVFGNIQDAAGNTMNSGRIVVHGSAGDILAYSMRGGEILIRGDAGTRVGIHMKAAPGQEPTLIVGGKCGGFLGEYMAGGTILLLRLGDDNQSSIALPYLGTGMHGGRIYIRGRVDEKAISSGLSCRSVSPAEDDSLGEKIEEFQRSFDLTEKSLAQAIYTRITPVTSRPYGDYYC